MAGTAMADLGQAVAALKEALDALEGRLADRLSDLAHSADAVEAARRQARTARLRVAEASSGLSAAIADLRSVLNEAPLRLKE